MELQIIGCENCPLWDSTGEEYGEYCHHPKALKIQRLYESGRYIDLPFPLIDGLYRNETPNGTYSVSVATDNVEIERDKEGNPITPNWCPLLTEPLLIKAKFQVTI